MINKGVTSYTREMKILIVEDDPKISSFITKGLKEEGYQGEAVFDGVEALDHILNQSYDLVILDLMLPKLNGLEVLKEVRSKGLTLPILVLSAKRSVEEKVEGLQYGADDYLIKPFAFSELLARIQVLLRRNQPTKALPTTLSNHGITMDLLKREVKREGKVVELQAKEFSLLEYFLRNPERVLTKTMILENVYSYNFDTQTNIVDVLVCRLRNKVDKEFGKKNIQTIRGVGYVLKED
jgi:two-component system OmpR family response regulator